MAYLCRANLRGANLTSADLRANLHQADLRGADLRGADLRGATLLNLGFVDAETSLARWNLRLEGELSEITAAVLTEIEAELRARLYDPQLKIRGFRLGSVILELAMSEDAAQLLQRLFKDGDLQQIMGYRILALEERLASEPAKVTTILVLGANPVDAAPLALDREMRAIEKAIRESKYKDSIELISRWAVGLEDLQLALLEHQPEIVHFSGHGLAEGVMLVNESGNGHVMQPELLAAVVCAVQDNVRLAVFNACYSHVQAEAITKHIDCAIGMAHTIDDGAALKFASAFYRAIGLGRSLQEAFDLGKATYHSVADVHACGPTMTVKDGVKPSDLCFFTPPAKKTRARKPSSLDSRAAVTAPATE
ncbi:MAG: pentapeptide repeat-containing protein [Proteobacteria bacterium]|nr:pentapeptide repeat-containing protein [Pseudomonadota bacterium]